MYGGNTCIFAVCGNLSLEFGSTVVIHFLVIPCSNLTYVFSGNLPQMARSQLSCIQDTPS